MAEKRLPSNDDAAARASARAAQKRSSKPILTTEHRKAGKNIIFEAMTRSGDAFGRPFLMGISTLTASIARKLKQKSFFGFETYERASGQKNQDPNVNKFTKYGSAPYRGDLRAHVAGKPAPKPEKP